MLSINPVALEPAHQVCVVVANAAHERGPRRRRRLAVSARSCRNRNGDSDRDDQNEHDGQLFASHVPRLAAECR